jgi:hypothetical protein
MGALLGNLKGCSFTRDFERWMMGTLEVQHLPLSLRELCNGEPGWGRGSFTREPGGCVQEDPGDGPISPLGPHWEIWKGGHIPGTSKDE